MLRLQWVQSAHAPILVHSDFTALRRLSQVELFASCCDLVLGVDWQLVPMLQSPTLWCKLYCEEQLLGLSRLSPLRCLDMGGCEPGNNETSNIIDTLVCDMQAYCPNVKLVLNQTESHSSSSSSASDRPTAFI